MEEERSLFGVFSEEIFSLTHEAVQNSITFFVVVVVYHNKIMLCFCMYTSHTNKI